MEKKAGQMGDEPEIIGKKARSDHHTGIDYGRRSGIGASDFSTLDTKKAEMNGRQGLDSRKNRGYGEHLFHPLRCQCRPKKKIFKKRKI